MFTDFLFRFFQSLQSFFQNASHASHWWSAIRSLLHPIISGVIIWPLVLVFAISWFKEMIHEIHFRCHATTSTSSFFIFISQGYFMVSKEQAKKGPPGERRFSFTACLMIYSFSFVSRTLCVIICSIISLYDTFSHQPWHKNKNFCDSV